MGSNLESTLSMETDWIGQCLTDPNPLDNPLDNLLSQALRPPFRTIRILIIFLDEYMFKTPKSHSEINIASSYHLRFDSFIQGPRSVCFGFFSCSTTQLTHHPSYKNKILRKGWHRDA